MGGGDINDISFPLNITVDIKFALFALTHAVLILTCLSMCSMLYCINCYVCIK